MRISGCVIAKNEEKNIKTCIESMKKLTKEIILVDTGSTDKTVEIAASLGARTYYYKWDNNFANAKNYALSKAKGDWILFLDADEYLTDNSVEYIKDYLKNPAVDSYDCILGMLINIDKNNGKVMGSLPQIRLFRNDKRIFYKGAIHETIVKLGGNLNMLDATENIQIIHTGYTPEIIKEKDKGERNLTLLLEEYKKNPYSSNICYYLAKSYDLAGDTEKALEFAKKALEYKNGNIMGMYQKNYYNIIRFMMKLKYPREEVRDTILTAIKKYPDYPDYYFILAYIDLYNNQLHDAAKAYEEGLKYIENAKRFQSGAHFQIKQAMGQLGYLYYKLNRLPDSIKAYVESLKSDKYFYFSLKGLLNILLKHEKEDDVLEFLHKIYDFDNPKDLLYILLVSLQEGKVYISEKIMKMLNNEYYDALIKDRALLHILKGDYLAAENLLKTELSKKGQSRYEINIGIETNNTDGNSSIYKEIFKEDNERSNENEDIIKEGKEKEHQGQSRAVGSETDILYAFTLLHTGNINKSDYLEVIENKSIKNILKRLNGNGESLTEVDKVNIFMLVNRCIQVKEFELVDEILRKLPEMNLYRDVAELYYNYECYDIAAEYYNKFIESQEEIDDSILADILIKMGECMYRLGQYDLSIEFFCDAGKIKENDYRIYEYGIMACEQINNKDMLVYFIEKGNKNFPDSDYISLKMSELGAEKQKEKEEVEVKDENRIVNANSNEINEKNDKPDELEENEDPAENDISGKMEEYIKQFKNSIQTLIEQGLLREAKKAIEEYEKMVKDDIDIYSIKGVMAMAEGDMDEAEEILEAGYKIDSNNIDILYNMACLYLNNGRNALANHFFKRIYNKTNDISLKSEIEKTVGTSFKIFKNKVLIGSPVYQKPHILKEFLQSLVEMKKDEIQVDYYFIDDNKDEESSNILKQFADQQENVFIYESRNKDEYICNNNTHYWKENLIWKVAKFKDMIFKYAKRNDYDYVFLIDSDIVLHPNTLKHLISTGKDIISEIFWTRWQPNMRELPQVWLMDVYTQYDIRRGEQLTQNDIANRTQAFLNRLRMPGIYEVGGLGACTLISRYAIEKGVSFKEIDNLSFWGEDRHFCIRAKALGLDLYVDTHYPAYHIYRETDLEGVNDFKKRTKAKVITLVNTSYSGSNNIAMYKLMPKEIKEKYYVELVSQNNSDSFLGKIYTSDAVIITEGNYHLNKETFNKKQFVMDLWHGFPLKAMGYVDKGEKFKDHINIVWRNINYIASYSELFNELMNQCIQVDINKYKILGAPRNDFLFITNGRENLSNLLQTDLKDKRIVLYAPTYRYAPRGNRNDGNRKWNNYFGFESFDSKSFNQFLRKNNIILLLKLHPAEEHVVINNLKNSENIKIITNYMLYEKQIDLYEILNGCDILITDYSSIYFDYLLLDRPIIFVPVDLSEYKENRGFLLEPYDDWTPGPKCLSQVELENEIISCLSDATYYQDKRKDILNKVHEYKDGFSTKRTWEFIDDCLRKI